MIDVARELYEAYIKDSGGLNYQGKPCPVWDELPEAVREHWKAVADHAPRALLQARIEDFAKSLYSQWREGEISSHPQTHVSDAWPDLDVGTRDVWLTLARRALRGA